jgi:hypothetical protein
LTLASFLILVATFFSQRQELLSARQELKVQNRNIARQRFENTFFQMVQLHHQLVNSITYTDIESRPTGNYAIGGGDQYIPVTISGRTLFENLIDYFSIVGEQNEFDKATLIDRFERLFKKHEQILGHYFRNLYHIIRMIDESEDLIKYDESETIDQIKSFQERKKYIRIIRAQLSSSELVLLLYNSLTENGEEFYDLIVKYQLLNNLNKERLPVAMRIVFNEMKQV